SSGMSCCFISVAIVEFLLQHQAQRNHSERGGRRTVFLKIRLEFLGVGVILTGYATDIGMARDAAVGVPFPDSSLYAVDRDDLGRTMLSDSHTPSVDWRLYAVCWVASFFLDAGFFFFAF